MQGLDPRKYGGQIRNPDDITSIEDLIAQDPEAFARDPQEYLKSQGLRLPTKTSLDEAKHVASQRAYSIFSNWQNLQDILDRHEDTIRQRWLKKSGGARRKVLVAVWPDMQADHHPEWKAMFAAAQKRGLSGPIVPPNPDTRDAFLLPHLNAEDLSAGKSLLVLLNARARHAPSTFALNDYPNFGVRSQGIVPQLIEEKSRHYMRLLAEDSPETYGSIYVLPRSSPSSGQGDVAADVGELILEAQDRTLEFLVGCVKEILHDIPPEDLLGDAYPRKEALPQVSLDVNSETITIASLAKEGPYTVPHAMDYDALINLVEAKRSEAEDHMWALREDPGFFLETAISRGEHRQESVLDQYGKVHPFKGTRIFWDRILTNLAAEAYSYLMSWTQARDAIQRISELHKKHEHEKSLPRELEVEILALKEFIDLMMSTPLLQLCSAVPGSPELRDYWIRDVHYPDPNVCSVTTKSPVLHDYLLMLFTVLQDNERRELFGLQNVVDEIERQIRREPKDKDRISPMVAPMLADLGLTGELQRQLKLYQPQLFDPFYKPDPDQDKRAIKKRVIDMMGQMMAVADHMDEMQLCDVGKPTGTRFTYPIDQPATQATVQQMRLAEGNLDKFWHVVDQTVLTRAKRNYGPRKTLHVLYPGMARPRELYRTPKWIEPQKSVKGASTTASGPSLSDALFELELRSQRTVAADQKSSTPKSKTKTRGATTDSSTTQSPAPNGSQSHTEGPHFPVNKRAHKVFASLFHDPSSPNRPGEVAWQDFLYAMMSAGFAFEKLYGSVWKFTPTNSDPAGLEVGRPINFHEPHPERKIPYAVARRVRRRLNRTYGWGMGTFVLE